VVLPRPFIRKNILGVESHRMKPTDKLMLLTRRHSKMQTSLDLERGYVSRLGVLVLLTIMIAPTLLIGQSKAKHPTEANWDCIQGKDFVRDRRGRAVWLSSHELESRV